MDIEALIHAFPQQQLARIDLPERPEILAPAPTAFRGSAAAPLLRKHARGGQLWQHQSLALDLLLKNRHTVIATGTASGKSLIFQVYAFHRLGQNPNSATIVFDPLRALAEDQLGSWREAAALAGIPPERIVKIDGSVPMSEREERLHNAAVAIMTPDVCHAWLMRNSHTRPVQDFIARLETIVLDEAHVYDSVFGSNAAYLFRRLLTFRRQTASPDAEPCRIIATTATISNAAEHLQALTGQPFKQITESQNGARTYPRSIIHIDGANEQDMADTIRIVLKQRQIPKFIAFTDSRQGVERIARQFTHRKVKPYRNGYEANDRRDIELALRNHQLDGVISTSALEMGINISRLSLGLNLKLPGTRKSFRQRLGRIGRDGPGLFVIVGPKNLFTQHGDTLAKYYDASAEPSVLYTGNKFVQFANAQCLARESAELPDPDDNTIQWPEGFHDALELALRNRPPDEYRTIAAIGRYNPHIAHPIRNISEAEIDLVDPNTGKRIGNTTLQQAIRETYPYAHYLHAGRGYRTLEWDHSNRYGKISVPMVHSPQAGRTEPITTVTITIRGIVGRNMTAHRNGLGYIAEVNATITETVVGCQEDGQLRQYMPADQPQRVFQTTGFLLRTDDNTNLLELPQQRGTIARRLENLTRYDCSIANWDIASTWEPMEIVSKLYPNGSTHDRALLVYDNCHGSLRLTEALYRNFGRYVAQLNAAILLDPEAPDAEIIKTFIEWAQGVPAAP